MPSFAIAPSVAVGFYKKRWEGKHVVVTALCCVCVRICLLSIMLNANSTLVVHNNIILHHVGLMEHPHSHLPHVRTVQSFSCFSLPPSLFVSVSFSIILSLSLYVCLSVCLCLSVSLSLSLTHTHTHTHTHIHRIADYKGMHLVFTEFAFCRLC